ncbi:hypothetical protein JW979_01155 [bacterium]|nr:hypothetical protein [candidate division CSSED10-310 bacterium]
MRFLKSVVVSILTIILCLGYTYLYKDAAVVSPIPLWDMAQNIRLGQHLACAVLNLDVWSFFLSINKQAFHPPLYGIIQIPFHICIENPFLAAQRCNWVIWGLLLILTAWISYHGYGSAGKTDYRMRYLSSLIIVLGLMGSPYIRCFGNISLTENISGLLLVIFVYAYSKTFQSIEQVRKYGKMAGITLLSLLLTKYSNVGYIIPVVLFGEVIRMRGASKSHQHRCFWVIGGIIGIGILSLLTAIYLTEHSTQPEWYFIHLSLRGLANIAFTLYALLLLFSIVIYFRKPSIKKAGTNQLSDSSIRLSMCRNLYYRIIFTYFLLPFSIWLLIPSPNRFYEIFRFFVNRSDHVSGIETYLFYGKVLLQKTMAWSGTGAVLIAGCLLTICFEMPRLIHNNNRSFPSTAFYCSISTLGSVVLVSFHSYQLERLLIPIIPLFIIAGINGFVTLSKRFNLLFISLFTVLFVFIMMSFYRINSNNSESVKLLLNSYKSPKEVQLILEKIADFHCSDRPIWIMGTFNEVSPPLIETYLTARNQGSHIIFREPTPPDKTRSEIRMISRTLADEIWHELSQNSPANDLIVITVLSDSPLRNEDWNRWHEWKAPIIDVISKDPRLLTHNCYSVPELKITLTHYTFLSSSHE